MQTKTFQEIFSLPTYKKPRKLRQTWLKDVGFDEAPNYQERMGLVELADFLEVAGERLDFVKIVTTQVLYSPPDWLKRKIETYQRFDIEPYLDHTYFMKAYQHGVVEEAIIAGRELGFRVIEFMNTADDVSPQQWDAWRQVAIENDIQFTFEYHPLYNWDQSYPQQASSSDEILRAATPFLEAGAIKVMIDHDEFDYQMAESADELHKVVAELGLDRLVFEVASPKDGTTKWLEHLESYFSLFGADCNVANIMPSQAMYVESLRTTS